MKTAYLSLGSNLGNRAGNIRRAIELLDARAVRVTRQSSLYETEPVDLRDQPWFLNCAVEAETDLMPLQLLHALLEIERELGRQRPASLGSPPRRAGPRVIDLDILLFSASVVRVPGLEIPHPRMAKRRFVLVPLNEIAPSVCHPVLRMTAAELLAETRDTSQVRRWEQKIENRK